MSHQLFLDNAATNSASREPTSRCWAPGALSSGQRFQPSKRNPLCAVATNARPPALGQDEWSESVKRLRGTRGQRWFFGQRSTARGGRPLRRLGSPVSASRKSWRNCLAALIAKNQAHKGGAPTPTRRPCHSSRPLLPGSRFIHGRPSTLSSTQPAAAPPLELGHEMRRASSRRQCTTPMTSACC